VRIKHSLSLYQSDQIMATNCQTSPMTTNNVSKPCACRMRERREQMKEMGEGEKSKLCVCVRERVEDEGLGDHLGLWKVG